MKKYIDRYSGVGLAFIVCLVSCSAQPLPAPKELGIKELYEQDLLSLAAADPAGLESYDYIHHDRFKQIFSGYSGAQIKQYFDERIKYAVTDEDNFSLISPSEFKFTNWYRDPDPKEQEKEKDKENKAHFSYNAFNVGGGLWISGLVDQTQVVVKINDTTLSIDSSRVGIMTFGSGYKEKIETKNGPYTIPSSYRHNTLLHEARHSDCTQGISESDLTVFRTARNPREFNELYKKRECIHHHVKCPEGHVFEGIPACDDHPWGAYSVSAIYADARSYNSSIPIEEWSILNAQAIDFRSRIILFNFNFMIWGEHGDPDMSHSGLL